MNIFFLLSVLIFCLVPGPESLIFSGIPLNKEIPFYAFLLLLAFSFCALIKGKISVRLSPRGLIPLALLWCFILLKLLAFSWLPPTGFKACYRALLNELPVGQCEQSPDFLWANGQYTRYDEEIDFTDFFSAGFWNNSRFSYYQWEKGHPVFGRYPFQVEWEGNLVIPKDAAYIAFEYTGELKVVFPESDIKFPASYNAKMSGKLELKKHFPALVDGSNPNDKSLLPVSMHYRFQDHSKTGAPIKGLDAMVRVTLEDQAGKTFPINSEPLNSPWAANLLPIIDLFAFVVFGTILLSVALLIAEESIFLLFLSPCLAWFYWFYSASSPLYQYLVLFPLSILSGIAVAQIRFKKSDFTAFLIFASFLFILFSHYGLKVSTVHFFVPGHDSMTYETFFRNMLSSGNLFDFFRGTEDIFLYQPAYRYYLAFMHLIFGDGNLGITIFNKFLYLLTLPLVISMFLRKLSFFPSVILGVGFLVPLVSFVFVNLESNLSEYSALLFFTLAIYLFFLGKKGSHFILGCAFLALGNTVRTHWLPGCVYFLFANVLIFYYRGGYLTGVKYSARTLAIGVGVFCCVYALVPIHNFVYGGEIFLTTSRINHVSTLVVPPAQMLEMLYNGQLPGYILERLEYMFYIGKSNYHIGLTFHTPYQDRYMVFTQKLVHRYYLALFMNVFSFCYIAILLFNLTQFIRTKSREYFYNFLILLTPFAFLSVHFFYQIKNYYPRHIIAGQLMAYFFSVIYGREVLSHFKNRIMPAK